MVACWMRPLLIAFIAVPCASIPYWVLVTKTSKCFQVDAVHEMTLQIAYHVPDMITKTEAEVESLLEKQEEKGPDFEKDGLDSKYNERLQRRMEAAKKAARASRDMNILVFQRNQSDNYKRRARLPKSGTGKIRKQLTERQGVIEFVTGGVDGMVEICVQSMSASKESPSRVSLNITTKVEQPEKEETQPPVTDSGQAVRLKLESSRIGGELTRMEMRTREIMANAEYAKDREVSFHEQSISLNRAVRYWPIFRILLLIFAGYLQVSHVVQYMKSRHIY